MSACFCRSETGERLASLVSGTVVLACGSLVRVSVHTCSPWCGMDVCRWNIRALCASAMTSSVLLLCDSDSLLLCFCLAAALLLCFCFPVALLLCYCCSAADALLLLLLCCYYCCSATVLLCCSTIVPLLLLWCCCRCCVALLLFLTVLFTPRFLTVLFTPRLLSTDHTVPTGNRGGIVVVVQSNGHVRRTRDHQGFPRPRTPAFGCAHGSHPRKGVRVSAVCA